MKKSILILIVATFSTIKIYCQSNYELLYLKSNLDQILEEAEQKSTVEDYFWHSHVLDKRGKMLEAIKVLEEGLQTYANNKQLELKLARLYYQAGDYLKAKAYLEKHQSEYEAFLQLINILEFQKQYYQAIQLLAKRVKDDSTDIRYLQHLAFNYNQIDSIYRALNVYNKAFKINPNDQALALKYAQLLLKADSLIKVIEVCDAILKNDSISLKFVKLKGIASYRLRDFNTAEKCFIKLYDKGDSSQFICKHLGICQINTSKFTQAREYLYKAYKEDSSDYETNFFLGRAYLTRKIHCGV